MRRDVFGLALLALTAFGLCPRIFGGSCVREAVAADAAGPTSVSACKVTGTAPMSKGTSLYDALSGGRVIAKFTGALVPMTLTGIPLDPKVGRAKLSTANG